MIQISPEEKNFITKKYTSLHADFDRWKNLYRDVRDFIFPYIGEFEGETKNSGYQHDEEMLRTMIIKYAMILSSGMQWGITSPTRPWLNTGVSDSELMKVPQVKQWFSDVDDIVMDILSRQGFYQENQKYYLEMAVFGTAAMFIEEDMKNICRFHTFTIGEYFVGVNEHGDPNSFARILSLTKEQIKDKFNLTDDDSNNFGPVINNQLCTVYHLIAPNPNYDATKKSVEYMRYKEWYYISPERILKVSGYNEFPVTVGRWFTKGSDVYGTGPGIWSLGDAKQLQIMYRNTALASELAVKPPMQAPSDTLANGGINLMPSAANYYNPVSGSDGMIKPLFQPKPDISGTVTLSEAIEDCIKEHFNVKVFQLLSDMDKGTRTAREVIELSAEKMSQMGPLVDRMETEILPQTIERVINICLRLGVFPPMPPEISNMQMQIKYKSVLAQAQKQNLITPIIDTFQQVINMATTTQKPEVLDKLNFDGFTDTISSLNGIPPELILSDQEVQDIRMARAKQQQMIQAAQMAAQSADIAKTASQAKLDNNNALVQVLGGPAAGGVGTGG